MIKIAVMEQREVPGSMDWLHPSERQIFDTFKFKKRQQDWLLGRWTAKNLVHKNWYSGRKIEELAILPGQNRAPFLYLNDKRISQQISISHSQGISFCVAGDTAGYIGCDLEKAEKRSDHFYKAYFTEEERKLIHESDIQLSEDKFYSLCWSAKEAVMKALRKGLSLHPLKLQVSYVQTGEATWNKLKIQHLEDSKEFSGIWKIDDNMVYVLVADKNEIVEF